MSDAHAAPEIVKEWRSFGGRQLVIRHHSACTGTPMEFSVFLPPFDDHLLGKFKPPLSPVLMYLSGLTCTWENVTAKGGYQRVAAELGLAVVCPDTSPRGEGVPDDEGWDLGQGAGFYVDATREPWSEHYRMWSYVHEELPKVLADERLELPLDLERIGLTGHSMGGHGALTLGLTYPDRYTSVSALAPIVAPSQVPWGHKAFGAYLGDDREAWKAHDACELVAKRQHPTEILIHQGARDAFFREQLRTGLFLDACEKAGQKNRIRIEDHYDHSYYFVASHLEEHLRHHAKIMGPMKPVPRYDGAVPIDDL